MNITMRQAASADVPEIVAMLADDMLGAGRENPADQQPYLAAFERLAADPNQLVFVAEDADDPAAGIVGTFTLAVLHGLSRQGASRGLIEAVRVRGDARGSGLGTELMRLAVEEARRRGCALVQLTSDVARLDAHRFYERFGFKATHLGFKMEL
ncbi:GNAT family N-acetyltransferase [Streptomyces sp. NPDC127098]|uniref:GNAT family N-acetyltransferase n=1 Tax=Streptomyces sp. NPDC127098 TaxID=3347137 RepID=UPI00364E2DB7